MHPLTAESLAVSGFPGKKKRTKHRHIVSMFGPIMPKSVGIDTNKLFSLTATQGAEGDADFKKCRIFKGFQNFSSMFFFAT